MPLELLSEPFAKAVSEHKYFLDIHNNSDISFDSAVRDFIVNHLVPWVESNPLVEYVEKGKQNLLESCVCLRDFNLHQIEALTKAIHDDQWFLGEKKKMPVDFQEAESDFYKKYLEDWAIKFRTGYCVYICESRHLCHIAEVYRQKAFESRNRSS